MFTKSHLNEVLLIGVVLVWGGNYTVSKLGIEQISPEMFTFFRFAIVFPVLLLLLWWKERTLKMERRDIGRLLLVGLIGIAIYQSLFMSSLKYTSATNSSLMIALSPIFTGILAVLSGQEKFTWRVQVGSLVAFLGACVVLLLGNKTSGVYPHQVLGDLIGLTAAFFWGWYPVLTAPLLKKYSSLRITAWSSGVGAGALLLFNLQQFHSLAWPWVAPTWYSILYSAIPVTVYGLVAWYYGVSQIGATKVMVYMYAIPVVAILTAVFAIHESINLWQILGAIVILVGITVVKTSGKKKIAKASTEQTLKHSL